MASNNRTSQAKSGRITKAQAMALLQRSTKKTAPVDAEDAADANSGGAEEMAENSGAKLKFGSPEWRAKYGRGKSKSVADALAPPMKAGK